MSLKNPPITEAVFDLRFLPHEKLTLESIDSFVKRIRNNFTRSEDILLFEVSTRIKQESDETSSNRHKRGVRLIDEKNNLYFQIRLDGITLSKIRPYKNWEELKEQAKTLLLNLSDQIPELNISRLALRYINEFTIEFENDIIQKHLNIFPNYPLSLPETMDSFSLQLMIPFHEKSLNSILNQSVRPNFGDTKKYDIRLDIDVFSEKNVNILEIDTIFETMEDIHEIKNSIFFESLTEKTIEAFN